MHWLFVIHMDPACQNPVDAVLVDITGESFDALPGTPPKIGGSPAGQIKFRDKVTDAPRPIPMPPFRLDRFSPRELHDVLSSFRPRLRFRVLGDPVPRRRREKLPPDIVF